jgi:hypothetical protein
LSYKYYTFCPRRDFMCVWVHVSESTHWCHWLLFYIFCNAAHWDLLFRYIHQRYVAILPADAASKICTFFTNRKNLQQKRKIVPFCRAFQSELTDCIIIIWARKRQKKDEKEKVSKVKKNNISNLGKNRTCTCPNDNLNLFHFYKIS